MKTSSIRNVLGCFTLILISACSSKTEPPIQTIQVKTVEISKPAPIVPSVDQLSLRKLDWYIITPENIDQKFKELGSNELVFFALTADGYKSLGLNLSDVRLSIEQYKKIIAVYKAQY